MKTFFIIQIYIKDNWVLITNTVAVCCEVYNRKKIYDKSNIKVEGVQMETNCCRLTCKVVSLGGRS